MANIKMSTNRIIRLSASFLIGFLVSIIICSLFAFTPNQSSRQVVVPAIPKQVNVTTHYYAAGATSHIESLAKQGWVLKDVTNGGKDALVIVVMEKY